MRGQFLSLQLDARRVTRCLALLGGAVLVGIAGLLAVAWAKHTWYDPWRSMQILQTLNMRTQTPDEQLHIIQQAMGLDVDRLEVRLQHAFCLTRMKAYKEAAVAWAYLDQHGTGPLSTQAIVDQGICHWRANEHAMAVACLQEGIRRFPERVMARVYLAAAYADLGLRDRARDELTMLANLRPTWRESFEATPEYPDEAKAAIEKLRPYLASIESRPTTE
jgi:Flp pilus assembly protein TadD